MSVLSDIKEMLGPDIDDAFNPAIVIHINSALSKLASVGACNKNARIGYEDTETWEALFPDTQDAIPMAKTYIYYMTRLGFDPPQNSFLIDSFKSLADEEYWRINDFVDRGKGGIS